jgi:hypothetical protein
MSPRPQTFALKVAKHPQVATVRGAVGQRPDPLQWLPCPQRYHMPGSSRLHVVVLRSSQGFLAGSLELRLYDEDTFSDSYVAFAKINLESITPE